MKRRQRRRKKGGNGCDKDKATKKRVRVKEGTGRKERRRKRWRAAKKEGEGKRKRKKEVWNTYCIQTAGHPVWIENVDKDYKYEVILFFYHYDFSWPLTSCFSFAMSPGCTFTASQKVIVACRATNGDLADPIMHRPRGPKLPTSTREQVTSYVNCTL